MLAADIGNTRIKTAIFSDNGELLQLDNFDHHALPKLIAAMENEGCGIISNVSGIDDPMISKEGFLLLKPGMPVPLEISYLSRESLGTDRIALACGAAKLFPDRDSLVISAGTCITYDFIREGRIYAGGGISPGIAMRYQSLHAFTGKLPKLDYEPVEGFLGNDTQHSIHTGVQRGIDAEIAAWVQHYSTLNTDLQIILSGGDAGKLSLSAQNRIFAAPDLLLQGLYSIYTYHAS